MSDYPVRIPDGDVFGFMESGADPAEQIVAEAESCIGDPRSYERALAWLSDPDRKPAVRCTGKPVVTVIMDALSADPDAEADR